VWKSMVEGIVKVRVTVRKGLEVIGLQSNCRRSRNALISGIKECVSRMKSQIGYGNYDIGVWICSESKIQQINKQFRNISKPTDVLSFPFMFHTNPCELFHCTVIKNSHPNQTQFETNIADDLDDEEFDEIVSMKEEEKVEEIESELVLMSNEVGEQIEFDLGDLVICTKYIERWSEQNNVDWIRRFQRVIAHGLCHLIGCKHENKTEYEKMRVYEEIALRAVVGTKYSLESMKLKVD